MIPMEVSGEVLEKEKLLKDVEMTRAVFDKFERSKILEVYFTRLDGRVPDEIPFEQEALYTVELETIKKFLIGQRPQDPILQKIFRMMS